MTTPLTLPAGMAEKPLLTVDDLACILPYTKSGIRNLARRGLFPAPIAVGGRKLAWNTQQVIDHLSKTCDFQATTRGPSR